MKLITFLSAFILLAVLIEARKSDGVITPFGSRPKECVHFVSEDYFVEDRESHSIVIEAATGNQEQFIAPCSTPIKRGTQTPPLPSGWAAYAYAMADKPITSYNGTWSVPADPQDEGTQTLFLFTGLQNSYFDDADVENIIQPVLQWGPSEAGGGEYWSLASWYVDSNDNAYYSTLTKTDAGNVITGTMVLGDDKKWVITAVDDKAASTVLTIATNTSEPYAFVTLEVYTVSKCLEYPTGSDLFYNLMFAPTFTPTWTPETDPGCEEAVTVSSSGVTITF